MQYKYEMPSEMLTDISEKGTLETFEYESKTYNDQEIKPIHKKARVYLPYGYNKQKKYDVLYLLHGGGFMQEWWFDMFPDTATILDNMITKDICKPVIVVAPTFYHDEESKNTHDEAICENFKTELRKDLIPGIESCYSTYACGDVSEENLIRTRNHRAFAGLSLGSMTTYRAAFYNNFDLFSYYGPFSGCCGPFGNHDQEVKRICETLKKGHDSGYELDFMFCANGDKDIAYEEHKEIMEQALAASPYLKKDENYDFFIIPGGVHDMKAWQLHLYHALQVFFTKEQ